MSYIDTRDLDERLTELEDMESAYLDSIGSPMEEAPLDDDEQAELSALRELRDEVGEWSDGNTMIPEDEFEDYARDLAYDIGAVPDGLTWPLTCIDWEYAARELAYDYSLVTWQGQSYYVRSV